MNKVLFGLILMFSLQGISQTICKYVDEFSDEVYYLTDSVILRDDNKTENGIVLKISLGEKKRSNCSKRFYFNNSRG